jgi:hypothetical protein
MAWKRYLVMVEEGSELGHEENLQLQEEMAAVQHVSVRKTWQRGIPAANCLSTQIPSMCCRNFHVRVKMWTSSGYTGKDEEVSEVDITGVTTEWGEEDEEVESVAHMCSGGERWRGKESPGKGSKNTWRGDGKEGVLKVQFCDEVRVHEFVPQQTAAREWEALGIVLSSRERA